MMRRSGSQPGSSRSSACRPAVRSAARTRRPPASRVPSEWTRRSTRSAGSAVTIWPSEGSVIRPSGAGASTRAGSRARIAAAAASAPSWVAVPRDRMTCAAHAPTAGWPSTVSTASGAFFSIQASRS
ncbi:hypothetical protein ACFSTC_16590 [Nonomuraea ferruginea]